MELIRFVDLIQEKLGREAIIEYAGMQPGDVPATYADVDDLTRDAGFAPATPIDAGIERFVAWCREFYRV